MITEEGIVTKSTPETAWITTTRTSACEHCTSKETCGTSHHGIKEMTVTVENTLGVTIGDPVVIGMDSKPMLVLSFLTYVFPIILLVLGALIGNGLAPSFGINPTLAAMVLGFGCFGAAFLFLRKQQNRIAQKKGFKPFLVKKKTSKAVKRCPSS